MEQMSTRFLSEIALREIFADIGSNVQVDAGVKIIGGKNIAIGSNVRIDTDVLLVAGCTINIGNFVHLGAAAHIFGSGGPVVLKDFCGLSSRVSIFSATDDYSGGYLTNPTVPDEYRNFKSAGVTIGRHAIIGCGSVVMPGVSIGDGASVGALSFVNKSVPSMLVVMGNPIRKIGVRDGRRLIEMEKAFREEYGYK
jgi:galactoside O-acetyltransferase